MPRTKGAKHSPSHSGAIGQDRASEPQSSYAFEENTNFLSDDAGDLGSFGNGDMDFGHMDGMFGADSQNSMNMHGGMYGGQPPFSMDTGAFMSNMQNVDPGSICRPAYVPRPGSGIGSQYTTHSMQPSPMSDILSKRKDNVRQQFGQITPPDDGTPSSKNSTPSEDAAKTEEDIAKANRTQRARNAANKRHAKSKKRKDSAQDENGEDVDDDDQNKTTTVQREKNRIAAAKCRAKKKATSEEMQDIHREGARRNSFLHREVRELRDQKAFLRNTLLQHEPGVCQCNAIHRFNFAQAQQVAMGVGAMIPQVPSPSQGSAHSAATPGSDASRSRNNSSASFVTGRPGADFQSRHQSFSGLGFPLHGLHDHMQTQTHMQMQLPQNAQSMAHMPQFSEFLQGSPEQHTGFH